jgi:hypothetical protein
MWWLKMPMNFCYHCWISPAIANMEARTSAKFGELEGELIELKKLEAVA